MSSKKWELFKLGHSTCRPLMRVDTARKVATRTPLRSCFAAIATHCFVLLLRRSEPPSQFGRILLAGYGGVSAVVSMVVMRGQGLGWVTIAVMTLGALVTLELARRLGRRPWGMAAK